MKRRLFSTLTAFPGFVMAFATMGTLAHGQEAPRAMELAMNELEFSREAGIVGIRSAFLSHFSDSSVMFVPRPVNGRAYLLNDTDTPGLLVWRPAYVEVSSSGDYGFTTGPSEYMNSKGEPQTHAHFLSVWKKNAEGKWKVILDIGNRYPAGEARPESLICRQLSRSDLSPDGLERSRESMLESDRTYSQLAADSGTFASVRKYGSPDVRVYRPGRYPAQGESAASEMLSGEKFDLCSLGGSSLSSAGDLGFTYGLAIRPPSDSCNYVRIWRREAGWKVVVDHLSPWVRRK